MRIGAAFWLAILLGAAPWVGAQEAPPSEPAADEADTAEPAPAAPWSLSRTVDDSHLRVSREVVSLGHRLDRLFGGRDYELGAHDSRLRVMLLNEISEDGVAVDPKVRLRLALPNTERRFNLIFESEDEDDVRRPGEAPGPVVFADGVAQRNSSYIAGVQYVLDLADYWNFDTSAGARLRASPELFVQARLGRSFFVNLWELRITEAVFWRRTEGVGSTTEFLGQRPLPGGPWFFRSSTMATWLHDDQQWYYSQDFSLSYEFGPLNAVQGRLGVRAESQPNTHVTESFVNVGWRRSIYKDWLFGEIRPELRFEREQNFSAEPLLFLIVEAFFGDYDWPAAQPDIGRDRAEGH